MYQQPLCALDSLATSSTVAYCSENLSRSAYSFIGDQGMPLWLQTCLHLLQWKQKCILQIHMIGMATATAVCTPIHVSLPALVMFRRSDTHQYGLHLDKRMGIAVSTTHQTYILCTRLCLHCFVLFFTEIFVDLKEKTFRRDRTQLLTV